jgi:hypothetical protein
VEDEATESNEVTGMNLQTSETLRNPAAKANAAGVLLGDLIDYAGLFPPASLSMPASIANYDGYSHSEWNWILGRFIVPVTRLGEFEETLEQLPASSSTTKLRLSALLDADPRADVARIREFNARGKTTIESVEVKAAGADEIRRLSRIIPTELATYFEVPLSNAAECIAAIARSGRRAKIRTGGETADKFPASASVIEFIRLCAASDVPFKATAGLHHPLRSVHRFTYQAESPSGMMHGFINLFLAAAFLQTGMDPAQAIQLLDEQSPEAFHFDSDGAAWRQHRLKRSQIARTRQGFAVSFGSCSFTEPIDDLKSLHLL